VNLARSVASLGTPEALVQAADWVNTATSIVGVSGDDYYKIADAYRDGIAGPERVADAEQYFNLAAEHGRADALKDIADGYMSGIWKDSTPERARTALASLVDKGDPAAGPMMIKAILNQQITAPLEEVEKLLEGSGAIDGDTYMKLIRLDEAGVFGDAHPDKQAVWLTRAAEGGSTGAMMRLYRAYASGIGVQVSAETASTWLIKAAEAGDQRAASELAAAYDTGFGLSADPVKAAYWRDRAKASS
jgi:TPR repeat protein